MSNTHIEPETIEVADFTKPFYDFCRRKRVFVCVDAENSSISARKDFDSRIDFDALASELRKVCTLVDLHVFASGTDNNDIVGGPYSNLWHIHPNTPSFHHRNNNRLDTNSDLLILFKTGQLLYKKRYQVLVIASGDGTLGSALAKYAKQEFGDNLDVVTLSLAGSTSPDLDATWNKSIAANFEIGCDLFIPFDQPRVVAKPSLWKRFCSSCYNFFYA
ncbi:MAG: hypothetical protein LBT05_14465 [Planctomycetaceae bacterium]|jgi:hypothetical protein|nr:hypothetical protein [Planctomycetaceae bacterium]